MADDSKKVARAHLVDAGVEELPYDWDVVTLGDLFTGDRGIAVGVMYPGDHDPEGVPLIKAGDLNGSIINPQPDFRISNDKHHEYRRTALEGGELLMTLVGNVGQCAVVPPRMAGWNTARAVAVMRLSDSSDTHFVQQCLLSRPLQHLMDVWSNTTVQATLNLKEIRQLPLPWPPKKSRDAIASILGALDDKIELNRRMNATLEGMARALFQSWFVDFDPVRAKLDGRKPEGLDKATAALFPDAFEESSLGPVPKGWLVSRLDEIASVMMGLSPDGESYNSNGIGRPLINGPVEFGDYFPVRTKWTEAATRFAAEGDLIFCVRGSTTGRRVVSDGEYGIGRGVCAIRAIGGYHSFIYQTINIGLDRLLEKTTGSVFPSLSAPDIKGFSVLNPSKSIIEAYERMTKPLIQRIQQNHHQSRTLATLRDTLLPKLLSGELSVGHSTITKGDKL